ncbi:MAG: DUF4363 family protein, partial [Ruminococcus sp.]|nr:DUF4363 family protein [Ruminococcus sp.]
MKRLIFALFLLLLCFFFCASSYYLLDTKTDKLISLLEGASNSITVNDESSAAKSLENCATDWKADQNIFHVFLNHKMLESLNINIPSILPLLQKG